MTERGGVVVTGASKGIGAAVVRELAGRGFKVFGTIRRDGDAAALREAGVTPVRMDVTDPASIASARAEVERALAGVPLVGLVNNAGVPVVGPLELLPLDDLRRQFEVNVVGVVAVTQAFLPLLRAAQGRIINISSVSGRMAIPFGGAYAASKFALEALSDSLRRELLPSGVDVVVVQPGSVRTPIWDTVAAFDATRLRETPYGGAVERFQRMALESGARGLPPAAVARVVARALIARRPRARYLVVRSALGMKLARLIPDRWLDRLIGRSVWR